MIKVEFKQAVQYQEKIVQICGCESNLIKRCLFPLIWTVSNWQVSLLWCFSSNIPTTSRWGRLTRRRTFLLSFLLTGFYDTLGPFTISLCILCVFLFHTAYVCITVSAVGWTWLDWCVVLRTYLSSVLWHCWLGHLTHKNPTLIWPIMCLVGC